MAAVFDAPVTTVVTQHGGWAGLFLGAAGQAQRHFTALTARLLFDDLAFDQEDLADVMEGEVAVEPT